MFYTFLTLAGICLIIIISVSFLLGRNQVRPQHMRTFEHSKDGVLILDKDSKIIYYNPSAALMLPLINKSMVGQNINDVLMEYDNLLKSVKNHLEIQLEIKNENCTYCFSVNSSLIYAKTGRLNGTIVTLRDMTTYFNAINRLNLLASIDELTAVHNRRCFVEHSFEKIAYAKKHKHAISFIILDLDHFKYINDTYGHQAGDNALITVAGICKKCVRSSDIVGRFGGEEFVILLPDTTTEEATVIANRICKEIETTDILFEGNIIKTTASFGITGMTTVRNESLETLLKNADIALYQAKAAGRNCTRVMPI